MRSSHLAAGFASLALGLCGLPAAVHAQNVTVPIATTNGPVRVLARPAYAPAVPVSPRYVPPQNPVVRSVTLNNTVINPVVYTPYNPYLAPVVTNPYYNPWYNVPYYGVPGPYNGFNPYASIYGPAYSPVRNNPYGFGGFPR